MSKYHGWSNRETWLANLWITNEQSYYMLLQAMGPNSSVRDKAEKLSELMREQLADEDPGPNLWGDLLYTAFGSINWLEVIENNK